LCCYHINLYFIDNAYFIYLKGIIINPKITFASRFSVFSNIKQKQQSRNVLSAFFSMDIINP